MIQELEEEKKTKGCMILLDCAYVQEEEKGTSNFLINLYKRSSCYLVKIGLTEVEAAAGFSSNAASVATPLVILLLLLAGLFLFAPNCGFHASCSKSP